jgi:hypothetical protein
LNAFALEDDLLREAHLVVAGYVRTARLDPALLDASSADNLRLEAQRVEGEFLGDAGRHLDVLIEDLAKRNARPVVRWTYEFLFLAYIAFVLYRVGETSLRSFRGMRLSRSTTSAGVFLVLWSGVLVMAFAARCAGIKYA